MTFQRFQKAFSLVEVLIVVTVLGIIATIAYIAVGDITRSSREHKLASDADTLNRAVIVYLASGGSLDGITSAADVLSRLKSTSDPTVGFRLPGMSSTLVDPRLAIKLQSDGESKSGEPRVAWNSSKGRFEVTRTGAVGVKEFYFDDNATEATPGIDQRTGAMLYAKDSGWIWDYQDRANPAFAPGPTTITVSPDTGSSPAPATAVPPPPAPPSPPAIGSLSPPVVSTPGGNYPINNYSLPVTVVNPNPAGSSKLVYAIDYGYWQDYSGVVTVAPGSVLSVQALALTSGWSDSPKVDQSYQATPITLSPPNIATSSPYFGLFFNRQITVTLTNPNKAGVSSMLYRINGGPWVPYSNPFVLDRANYLMGANIEARAVSTGSPYYLDSVTNVRNMPTSPLELTGTASGRYSNPTGPNQMVTNLPPGGSSNYFEWGDLLSNTNVYSSKSWMRYDPGSFATGTPGQRFLVGGIEYFNGSVKANTGADTVDLTISLNLNVNGTVFQPSFRFNASLINTPNLLNPANPWADADYVRLNASTASQTIVINGYEYDFRLEFGETTSNGFSNFSEFHVLEAASATVKLYGTFVEIGPVATTTTAPTIGSITNSLSSLVGAEIAPASPAVVYQKEKDDD